MHGRLKVKTSAEQAERKRLEREKKVQLYTATTKKIFEKRARHELDNEMLMLTGQILAANPDFYTLWNIRREILVEWINTRSADDTEKLLEEELYFLEQCLPMNHKSYSVWHQRQWVTDKMSTPNWTRELSLCSKFLEQDERNFHCWDYRRFVVKRSNVSAADELDFTTKKISSNFSNFSSWHYRSKLLPIVHPAEEKTKCCDKQTESSPHNDDSGYCQEKDTPRVLDSDAKYNSNLRTSTKVSNHSTEVNEKTLLEELNLVENAYFTDPNDQSAWFYHRWLMGREQRSEKIDFIHINCNDGRIIVTLTKPVKVSKDCQLSVSVDGEKVDVVWTTPDGQYSVLWMTKVSSLIGRTSAEVVVQLHGMDNDRESRGGGGVTCGGQEFTCLMTDSLFYWRQTLPMGTLFRNDLGSTTSSMLSQQLDSCKQLHEIEPDNKWVLLTVLSMMRAVDPCSSVQSYDTAEYIDKLVLIDPMRTRYYRDQQSRYLFENAIESQLHNQGSSSFTLSSQNLTVTYHLQHLVGMTFVDLSHNSLRCITGGYLLQCVRVLDLSYNQLSSSDGIHSLEYLEEVNLFNNDIKEPVNLSSLASCRRLSKLHLTGNPVCLLEGYQQHVQQLVSNKVLIV